MRYICYISDITFDSVVKSIKAYESDMRYNTNKKVMPLKESDVTGAGNT
ncbi:MAG: hypothetical protein ACRC0V_11710 [Fusobacteriaceae bacterium]